MSKRTEATTDDTETSSLSTSERHRLLASTRRRHVLGVLAEEGASVELSALATAVAVRERGRADDATVERVTVALHHSHLPRLAAADVLEYDREEQRVTARGDAVARLQNWAR